MPKLPLFPSRQHERGGSHERTDGNLTTEEEWFLEIKLDDLNLSNDSTWLTLRGKRKRMRERQREEEGKKNLRPSTANDVRRNVPRNNFDFPNFGKMSLLLLAAPAAAPGGIGWKWLWRGEGGMMVHYATWARGILHLCQPAKSRGWVFVVCL